MKLPYDKQLVINKFKYDPADEGSILQRASQLVGLTVRDIIDRSPNIKKLTVLSGKGAIGNIVEKFWFGIANNPLPEPDFAEVGIELKVIPLEASSTGLTVKERTKICAIDYHKLIDEKWDTSHAKKKLKKILFIYYKYDSKDPSLSKVVHYDLWQLGGPDEVIMRTDWEAVQDKVYKGFAHHISESMSRVLAACRSGQGGRDKNGRLRDQVGQPKSTAPAMRRAFALKQAFTKQRWLELHKHIRFESIIESLKVDPKRDLEQAILGRLHKLEGKTVGHIADEFKISIPSGKNAVATIIKKALGFKNVNSRIKEFEQFGIQIRVLPVRRSDNMPWEAVSFPTFKLKELAVEEWDEADIREYLECILFVPVYRDERTGDAIQERIIGKAFFWSPSAKEWATIYDEWLMYRNEVKTGKAKITKIKNGESYKEVTGLTKESQTNIIHIRPHGKDRKDRDIDPLGNSVVKQSFWLNKHFVHKLILNSLRAH